MVTKKRAKQLRIIARARRFRSPIGFSSKRARKLDLSIRAVNPRRKGRGRGNTGDFSKSERESEGFFDDL